MSSPGAEVVSETDEIVKILGQGNPEKEQFPLKMRDAAQAAGFAYIKSKGLIPEDDSDDYIPVSSSSPMLSCSCLIDLQQSSSLLSMQSGSVSVVSAWDMHETNMALGTVELCQGCDDQTLFPALCSCMQRHCMLR